MVMDSKVRAIARSSVVTIDEGATVEEAAKLMGSKGIGALAVTREGRIVGIITERDVLKRVVAEGRDPKLTRVREAMTSPPITVSPDTTLREAIDLMNRKKIRRLLVEEAGRIVGIFTQRDILALTRICLYCTREVSLLAPTGNGEPLLVCGCGAIYHRSCASTVVYCLDCSAKLVEPVRVPAPEDTLAAD
ncbi:MAG: CBS domain-containing protein [Thaumarchaeota archaeon]|nr:CBS domain-containing protein [Candidatus Calditenuaceae archaeon]MDW8043146.1 CBS domain-containing protein [Nitrososphaerota archaeon]